MRSAQVLARQARSLNRAAGAPPVPSLYCFTDRERTPNPRAIAERLPRGTALVYRHFGATERRDMARALARICRRRGLFLLIAADPALARAVGADGVHWPESRAVRRKGPGLQTMAAHDAKALARAAALGMDAAVLSPVLPTRSKSGRAPLGVVRAGQLVRAAKLPVIALGGINHANAHALAGRGFAGLACVDALARA